MARNKQSSQRTAQATADGYENFVARVGMQTPNQHSASTYRANFTSRNRMLVEWSYRGSWVIGEAVDAIPDDMTRKGIRITSEIDAKDRGTLEAQLTDLRENSDVTGIGASITDEDIENAEDEAPPGIGELGDKPPESPGGDPISNEPTADSAGGRGYRKWALRWFKR